MEIKINDTLKQNIEDIMYNDTTSLVSQILLLSHPVGSYYWSDDNTNPSTLFGGIWEPIQDKFIVAAGTEYIAGNSYGNKTIDLSHNPTSAAHTHGFNRHTHTTLS